MSWSISLTAPSFSPEQERHEREVLDLEVSAYITAELFGRDKPFLDEDAALVDEKLAEMETFIASMPDMSKADLLEARQQIPHLVRKETSPRMFLRCENYDSEKAASRMASHWKHRRQLFREKAFDPMTICGAMRDDIEELERGFFTICPHDVHGRPVLFLNRTGSTKSSTYDRDSYLRCMWYLFHIVAESEENQKRGYVLIINLKDYDPHICGDRIGAKKTFLFINEAWCPRMKGYHATYSSRQTAVKLVEPAIRQMQGPHIRLHLINQ